MLIINQKNAFETKWDTIMHLLEWLKQKAKPDNTKFCWGFGTTKIPTLKTRQFIQLLHYQEIQILHIYLWIIKNTFIQRSGHKYL